MTRKSLKKGSTIVSALAVAILGATVLTYQACGDFATMHDQTGQSSVVETINCEANSLSLNTQAERILTTNCQNCHGTTGTTSGLNSFHAVFDISKMIAEGDVIPGDASSSLLYQKISPGTHGAPAALATSTVSPGGLSATDIEAVANWINQGLVACSSTGGGASGVLSFTTDVLPLLTKHNCLNCHSTANTANGNVGLKNYTDAVKTIVALDPTNSPLVAALPKMTGTGYGQSPMTTAELTLIGNWVLEGASK